MKRAILFVSGLIFLGIIASTLIYFQPWNNEPELAISDEIASEEVETQLETITLTAAGDCLMHNTQIMAGLQADGTYNFDTYFREVEDLIRAGDYAAVTFEAPMAGKEKVYTGYPVFNSPDAIANTFKDSGFDLIVTSNNHILDKGITAALRTMQIYKDVGLDTVGTYMTEEESRKFLIKDIRGVKVGYLGYGYGTNGIPVPKGYEFFFNFLDEDKILADIKAIRSEVDILIVMLHWGVEYSIKPTQEQEILAKEILRAGADAIIGSHPHVIQPMEIVEIDGQKKVIAYAIGNFISHQRGVERNSGIVLKLKFSKDFNDGRITLEEVSYTPTFSHHYNNNGKKEFRVVPVQKTIEKIVIDDEPFLSKTDLPVLESILDTTTSRLGEPYYADKLIEE
ncbi:MAG TPA: CapA family protein [Syntrophomonadaceae bacterium]|nr:CapA family protein [Syntrophomonadaceae bacterium]